MAVRGVEVVLEVFELGEVSDGVGIEGGDVVGDVGGGWGGDGEEREKEDDEGLGEVHGDGCKI